MALGEKLRKARLERKLTTSQVAAATRMKVQIVEGLEREDFSKIAAPIYGKGFIKLYAEEVGLDPRPLVAEYVEMLGGPKQPSLTGKEAPAPIVSQAPPSPSGEDTETATRDAAGTESAAQADAPAIESEPERSEETGAGGGGSAAGEARARAGEIASVLGDVMKRGAEMWGAAVEWVRAQRGPRPEPEPKPEPEPGKERETEPAPADDDGVERIPAFESPARSISVILGIIIILVFIISCLSRCVRQGGDESVPASGESAGGLNVAVDPPPPYVD
jgi:hypothetical protein